MAISKNKLVAFSKRKFRDTTEDTNLLFQLGQVTRLRREALGFTARQLGSRSTIAPADIASLEKGTWDIDLLSLMSLSNSFGISMAAMIEEAQNTTVTVIQTSA